jgi:hypothetical protein
MAVKRLKEGSVTANKFRNGHDIIQCGVLGGFLDVIAAICALAINLRILVSTFEHVLDDFRLQLSL